MRIVTRLSSSFAAFAVIVAIGAGAALAVHNHTNGSATLVGAKTVNPASAGVLVADNPAPANQVHTPHAYTPLAVAPVAQAPAAGGAPVRAPSAPSLVIRSNQQVMINRDRAGAGLRPLSWSSCLASIAAANAARMARQNYMSHTNGATLDLGCHLGNQGGENVGWWSGGINDAQLNTMFMNSPEHHANIMGPYHYVATAWAVSSNGTAYIAVEFG